MNFIPDIVIIIGQLEEINAVKECQKLNLRSVTILDTDKENFFLQLFLSFCRIVGCSVPLFSLKTVKRMKV